jgi:outer membrane protein assembly factor BamE (lipoprotein component of BamABCDE complex)
MGRALSTFGAAILVLGALAGCINSNSARGVEPLWEELGADAFERGRTTRSEVLERLGPPSQILSLTEGTAFYYLLETTRARGVVLVVYNDRGERTRYSRAVFFFDGAGTLTDFAVSRPEE